MRVRLRAPTRLPEPGVAVEGDLAVEGEDLPLRSPHKGIDLDEDGVLPDQHLPQPYQHVDGLRGKSGRVRDLARLRRGDAFRRVDVDPGHRLGPARGDLLDLHAAFRGGDGEEPPGRAVEDVGDVELRLDVHGLGQHHLADAVALDVHADDLSGRQFGGGRVGGELHSARLATSARLHLRLDDDPAAEPTSDLARLLGGVRDLGPRDQDAVFLEEFPCLVLVQVHSGS